MLCEKTDLLLALFFVNLGEVLLHQLLLPCATLSFPPGAIKLLSNNLLKEVSMKRSLLGFATAISLFCITFPVSAQIPNPGFENWVTVGSYMNPVGWFTTNVPTVSSNVSRSTVARSGSFALRGEVVSLIPGFPTSMPVLVSTIPAFPWTQRSAALTGYYQFTAAAGSTDSLFVSVLLYKGGTGYGAGGSILGGSSSYRQFSAPIFYGTSGTPDSAAISVIIAGPGNVNTTSHIGSFFLLDDLAFSGTASAVEDGAMPQSFTLGQNYPNPFNPSTTISYSIAQPGFVSLKVYNVLGVEIATLVNDRKDAGSFSVNWNAAGLPSGVYLYRLSATSERGQAFDQSKRLVLLK